MSDPNEIARGVRSIERIKAALEEDEDNWWVLVEDVANEACVEIDAMYAAMTPRMQDKFLRDARSCWGAYESIIQELVEKKEEPRGWMAVEQWTFRQPLDMNPSTFPPEQLRRFGIETFLRILPFFGRMGVEEVLDNLHVSWRQFRLARFAHGVRRGLDVFIATARANGQDETPFHRLMEWSDAHPPARRRSVK